MATGHTFTIPTEVTNPTSTTFVPFSSAIKNAQILADDELFDSLREAFMTMRLFKDRAEVETKSKKPFPESGHLGTQKVPPDLRMPDLTKTAQLWIGDIPGLGRYLKYMAAQYRSRGHRIQEPDREDIERLTEWARKQEPTEAGKDARRRQKAVVMSHQHHLCARNWEHYGGLFPEVFDDDVGTAYSDLYFPGDALYHGTLPSPTDPDWWQQIPNPGDFITQVPVQTIPPNLPKHQPGSLHDPDMWKSIINSNRIDPETADKIRILMDDQFRTTNVQTGTVVHHNIEQEIARQYEQMKAAERMNEIERQRRKEQELRDAYAAPTNRLPTKPYKGPF